MAGLYDNTVTIQRENIRPVAVRPVSNRSKVFSSPVNGIPTDFALLVYR